MRSAGIISSSRLPRLPNSWPVCSNSSRIQPAPTPRFTRLFDSTAAVPTCFATVNRSRAGAMYTDVPNCNRSVTAAIALIVTQLSGHAVSGGQIGAPSGEYGYGDARSRG